jgi:His-Xaa-Ser system radical SAM maturase HxsC
MEAALPPFVVRLNADWVPERSRDDAFLECAHGDTLTFDTSRGKLILHGLSLSESVGDVLLVIPQRHIAHRLIRAASTHNTLVATERCDQLCVMCSQPPKEHHTDWFSYFTAASLLAPQGACIGISGGEPTLYKEELFALFGAVQKERPDVSFHVLSNGQHFEERDIPQLRQCASQVQWGIPLYSHSADTHDGIVAKAGAFAELMESFGVLLRSAANIELRTVVMKENVRDLPALGHFTASHLPFVRQWSLMQLERIGYAKKNWQALFFDHSTDFDALGRAISIATLNGLNPRLYNFPLCTVPEQYRELAPVSISDWKRRYLAVCEGCALRSSCTGVFEWYDSNVGFERIGSA